MFLKTITRSLGSQAIYSNISVEVVEAGNIKKNKKHSRNSVFRDFPSDSSLFMTPLKKFNSVHLFAYDWTGFLPSHMPL